jgi:ABC-type dipeptide/oligopeptide/nickel transport system permease component
MNELLAKLAPLLGTAIAGPFGGIAASFIADKLGVPEKTVKAVSEAISADKLTPDQVAQVKLAEIDFKKWMTENDLKADQLAVQNTQGARDMQTAVRSNIPGTLAIVIVSGFFAILICMMLGLLKVSDQQSLLILLGALSAGFGSVLNFYFGSSHGSQNKDALLANSTPSK